MVIIVRTALGFTRAEHSPSASSQIVKYKLVKAITGRDWKERNPASKTKTMLEVMTLNADFQWLNSSGERSAAKNICTQIKTCSATDSAGR